MEKSGTFVVENSRQKVLFDAEIKGQLSDGHWENATPDGHYIEWCGCDVRVAEKGEDTGRDFWVRKDGYRLTSADLLEVVGVRMRMYVRFSEMYPEVWARLNSHHDLPDPLFDWEREMSRMEDAYDAFFAVDWSRVPANILSDAIACVKNKYWAQKYMDLLQAGVTRERFQAAYESLDEYPESELREDLGQLQKAMKKDRRS